MGRHHYSSAHWQDVSSSLCKMTQWERRSSLISSPDVYASNQHVATSLLAVVTIWWIMRGRKKQNFRFKSNISNRPFYCCTVIDICKPISFSLLLGVFLISLISSGVLQHCKATSSWHEYNTGHISIFPKFIVNLMQVWRNCHMGCLEYYSLWGLAHCGGHLILLLLLCGDVEVNPGPYEEDHGLYLDHMSRLPPAAHHYLDKMVDYDHSTVYKDLYKIAHYMLHWDSLASELGLDDMDVADIKHDHRTAEEQRIAALLLWKQKTIGTYHDLLKVCCNGGDTRTAAVICDIVMKKADHPNKTEMKEELIKAVNEGKIVVSRNTATINLAGLPGSGKTMLIDRMLGRPIRKNYFSTGVSEPTIMVDINPSPAMYTVSVNEQSQSSGFIWQPINYDTSFLSQYYWREKHTSADSTDADENSTNKTTKRSGSSASSDHDIDLNYKINGILDRCGVESIKDLETKGSLYIRDVGGQIEFQESLSLLIYGSSIYLFVFKATIDIDKKQEIRYRDKHGKVYKYQSLISTKDALLQLLTSVKALQITKNSQKKENVKPRVFIVGTYMDELSQSGITREVINQQLDTIIIDSKCKEFVKYKKKKKEKNVEGIITVEEAVVMFGVDNISEIDDGRKNLRVCINKFFTKSKLFEVKYAVRHILFALNLPNIKPNVLKLQECELIAKQFKIKDIDVPHLLHFLHLRTGILQWFDVEDLRDWVFKEPQFLFNKITALIIKTFIDSDEEDEDDVLQFRKKGIFEKEMIKTILSGDDTPTDEKFKFLDFLIHLRMVAHFYDAKAQKDKYFIPCVLNHVPSSLSKIQSDIPPLNITFECGYCPKGLFGVLATYFIEHPWKCKVKFTITFNYDHIYKDEIAFIAIFGCLRHNVYLKMDPSKLEVTFCGCEGSIDTQLYTACNAIRTAVSKYIDDSLDHLRYNKHSVKPIMNLQCPLVGCTCTNKLHEVEMGEEESKIYCKHVPHEIPSKAKYWFPEEKISAKVQTVDYHPLALRSDETRGIQNAGADNVDGPPPALQRETGTQDIHTAGADNVDGPPPALQSGTVTPDNQTAENCCKIYGVLTGVTVGMATGIFSFVAGVVLISISKMPPNHISGGVTLLVIGAGFVVGSIIACVIMIIYYKKRICCLKMS